MKSNRRQFLSRCAAAGIVSRAVVAAGEAQNVEQQMWPSTFPALRQRVNEHPLSFLDSAATTLRPQSVIDALVEYYSTDNANPSRVHTLASRAADRLSNARQTLARFVNATDPTEIIFVRGTTEGINLVASTWGATNLRADDEVVLTIAEHSSNLLPWSRAARQAGAKLRVVDVDDEGRPRLDHFKEILSKRTRIVAFTHVSNVLGYINPAREMCALAREVGAGVVIDGAQGAPHVKIDVQDIGCDFYVFSGHKMLGPMGTGVVWGRRELLDTMPPYHVGSNMAHDVDFERADFEHGALKFQAGTPDVAGRWDSRQPCDFLKQPGLCCGVTTMNSCSMAWCVWPKSHACESLALVELHAAFPCSRLFWKGLRRRQSPAHWTRGALQSGRATWPLCRC
jgi:cysteine desulfurase / selenocysteine lyase